MSTSMAGNLGTGFATKAGEEAASAIAEWIKKPENRAALKNGAATVGAPLAMAGKTAVALVATPAGALVVGAVVILAIGAVVMMATTS
ncbi:hypothetical protein [Streptomyces sp. NRRL F-525]|uniref:hypothetical protein n=1 Tax=Streptomyces sp. NRRL F-525 TaxID=1463861 RepID=UPI00131B1814|nr:hypothetical protein [Streptomyces sp. NRRL F-525]